MNIERSIRKTVTRLGRFFPFRQLFLLYYRAALSACAACGRADGGVEALLAHRGWTRGDWTPGVSDLDLFVVLGPGGQPVRWAAASAKLKKIFPVIGEWLCATRPELDLYSRHGDLRAAELAAFARPLCGRGGIGRGYRPGAAKLRVDAWNECFHAHARLCNIFFSRQPGEAGAYGARKSLLDLERYGACAAAGPEVLPANRTDTERALFQGNSGLRGLLLEISSGPLGQETALAAVSYSASALERAATAALAELGAVRNSSRPEPTVASAHECGANARFGEELKARLGAAFRGAVTDTLFESYFVFDWGDSEKTSAALHHFRDLAAGHPALSGAKILLGPDSMRLLSACLRIEDPASCGFGSGETAVGVSGRSLELQAHRRASFFEACGGWAVETGRDAELRREAFAKMLISWRYDAYQGAAGEEKGRRLKYYWLPRAAHFYLFYVHGLKMPCYPAEPLLEAVGRVLPQSAPRMDAPAAACAELVREMNAASIQALK